MNHNRTKNKLHMHTIFHPSRW